MSPGLLAAVLAGGQGRRMGGRKETVFLHGHPLLAYPWNALAPVAGGPVVLQGAERGPPGLLPLPDARQGQGPLGGVETLLRRARDEGRAGVVLCAVDLPRVPASMVIALVRRWRQMPEPEGCAVVLRDAERVQPLVGVYGAGLLASLTDWLEGRADRAVHAWIDALGDRVQRLPPWDLDAALGHGDPLLNVNRPEELEEAALRPLPAPPIVSVVGWKDSGKTSTATALVRALRKRGSRVMALKHGHRFHLDREGTDSARLRGGGAERVLLAGPDGFGVLGGWPDAAGGVDDKGAVEEQGGEASRGGTGEPAAVELAARYLAEADVVVAEGWKGAPLPAIEVQGPDRGDDPPLWSPGSPDRDRFLARVMPGGESGTASDPEAPPVLDREDPDLGDRLAVLVEARVMPGWQP